MAMINGKKILWAIIILLAVLNLSSIGALWLRERPVHLQRIQRIDEERRRGHFLARELHLTKEQQASLESLRDEHRKKMVQLTYDINQTREKLLSLLENGNEKRRVDSLASVIAEEQKQIELLNYRHFRQVMQHLNDEQKRRFAEIIRQLVHRPPRHEPDEPEPPDPEMGSPGPGRQ